MSTCKHSWKWKEKEYQDGVPKELYELLMPWNIFIGRVNIRKTIA